MDCSTHNCWVRSLECLSYLLEEAGASATVQNINGFTPLHVAVVYGNEISVVRLLLEKGGTDILDDAGNSPLALACKNRRLDSIKVLLFDFGADPFSPSITSSWEDYDECVKKLIERGKKEERIKNDAWVSMLKVSRYLILLKGELGSTELQLMTLSQLPNSKFISKRQSRILSDTFLDRRSIGHLLEGACRQSTDKPPRLLPTVQVCQDYLES